VGCLLSLVAVTTREQILDVAMELFSRHGYEATSIVQIEKAAGLKPGGGGIYHHFRTKQELLEAGIERHLGRLAALRDIQGVLTDLGDLRAELMVLARYTLSQLDHEAELLRIVLGQARTHPELVEVAVEALIRSSYVGFAHWLSMRGNLTASQAKGLSAVGFGALLSSRLLRVLLGSDPADVDDEVFVSTWVTTMLAQIDN
jgi:AcrR family transcriptional regulator